MECVVAGRAPFFLPRQLTTVSRPLFTCPLAYSNLFSNTTTYQMDFFTTLFTLSSAAVAQEQTPSSVVAHSQEEIVSPPVDLDGPGDTNGGGTYCVIA